MEKKKKVKKVPRARKKTAGKAAKKPAVKKAVKRNVKKSVKKPRIKAAPKKKAHAKKPGVRVTVTRKILGKAPHEQHFYLADGNTLGSVIDLADALRGMSDEIFVHHVNEGKNDFANWINEVFEEPDFAEEIRSLNDKVDTEIACLRKLISTLKEVKKSR